MLVSEAHKRKLKVAGHLGTITYREAAELSIDNLEHGFFVNSYFDHERRGSEFNPARENKALANLDVNSVEMKSLIEYLIQKKVATLVRI